jgi:hypothetical protein
LVTLLLAWFAVIGVDFFIHAGVLARLYVDAGPFVLPPERAFALIPIGYLSYLALVGLMVWLAVNLGVRSWRQGLVFGLKCGVLLGLSFALGLLSIAAARPLLLIGWGIAQAVEMGVAGLVIGRALGSGPNRGLITGVLVMIVVLITATMVLQALGIAPPMRARG